MSTVKQDDPRFSVGEGKGRVDYWQLRRVDCYEFWGGFLHEMKEKFGLMNFRRPPLRKSCGFDAEKDGEEYCIEVKTSGVTRYESCQFCPFHPALSIFVSSSKLEEGYITREIFGMGRLDFGIERVLKT